MKEKKKLLQKNELCRKGKVYIINFSFEEKVDITNFSGVTGDFFQRKKLVKRYFLSIYDSCMIF